MIVIIRRNVAGNDREDILKALEQRVSKEGAKPGSDARFGLLIYHDGVHGGEVAATGDIVIEATTPAAQAWLRSSRWGHRIENE